VTRERIGTDPKKIAAIDLSRTPAIPRGSDAVPPDFSRIVKPLNDLLRKGRKWEWTPEHQMAFEELKARLVADPVLACPDFSRTFTLQTCASDYGIGATLTQDTEKGEKVSSYSRRTLNGAEKKTIQQRRRGAW